jgi:hypothetical protein
MTKAGQTLINLIDLKNIQFPMSNWKLGIGVYLDQLDQLGQLEIPACLA